MSDLHNSPLAAQLLEQDSPASEKKYQEYRMQLEQELSKAVRRERRTRFTVIAFWVAGLLSMFGAGIMSRAIGRVPEWYGAIHFVIVILVWVETISYLIRFLPARLRAGSALQTELLRDLDRRVRELSHRVEESHSAKSVRPEG
ncbi:MAG: hypothetical protein AB7O26_10165 [Planctomycetaceae bacterium]